MNYLFKMVAAGPRNDFPCHGWRGISDYADSDKICFRQRYAAAAIAAAFAKELLTCLPLVEVSRVRKVVDILNEIHISVGHIDVMKEQKVNEFLQALSITVRIPSEWIGTVIA